MIRITGGEFQGRKVHTPAGLNTRPTVSIVRQAIFNSIQSQVPNSNFLDLFSGSGILGLEALSRGAQSVCFVEASQKALSVLRKNLREFEVLDESQVLGIAVEKSIQKLLKLKPFQFVIADPPYQKGLGAWLLEKFPWDQILDHDGIFILECDKNETLPDDCEFLEKTREKIYGTTKLIHYKKK